MKKKKFTWSYSSLTSFETCPYRWYLTRWAKKVEEPQTESTLWGNRVHKALEERVKQNKPLPEDMEKFEPIVQTLIDFGKGAQVECEQKLAINKNFQKTGYFDHDVWLRSIADITITKGDKAFVGDYKTGKMANVPDSDQLALNSAVIFIHKPWVKSIVNAFVWLKERTISKEVFHREDLPAIWNKFLPRVRRMEQAIELENFPARPSGLCRAHCPCTQCPHNGRYNGSAE